MEVLLAEIIDELKTMNRLKAVELLHDNNICTMRDETAEYLGELADDYDDSYGEAKELLRHIIKVIESAGVHNLSNGVELGQTVWSVKMNDALDMAKHHLENRSGK